MPSPTVVFDLDGTLVDTAPDLIDTLNIIFARHDVAPVAFDEARMMIGAGVKPLLQRGLASKGVQLPPEALKMLDGSSEGGLIMAVQGLGLRLEARKAPLEVINSNAPTPRPSD